VGVHCGIYKSSYNISNTSHLNSPSLPFSFIHLPAIPEIASTGTFFHLHTCVQSIYTIFTLPHLFSTGSNPTGSNPIGRTCSALLFSDFVKEKKWYTIFICRWHNLIGKRPEKLHWKLLDTINNFSKVAGHKTNLQKSVAFLYNKEQTEKERRKIIAFTLASKKNQLPRYKLSKGYERPLQGKL
jgi:hypothetical protein